MEAIDVGKRIKSFRKRKGLTLQELAERSSVSATAISAIERNVSSPTVNTLASIGKALGESLSSLLGETEARYVLTRRGERTPESSLGPGTLCEGLGTTAPGCRFRPVLAMLAPGAESADPPGDRAGEDFLFVLRGNLQVDVDGGSLPLSEGDALCLGSGTPYRFRNDSAGETVLLMVTSS
jgi:transcriptional regulator with XRE-family HTH domain